MEDQKEKLASFGLSQLFRNFAIGIKMILCEKTSCSFRKVHDTLLDICSGDCNMLVLSLCLCISIFLINATNKLIVCSCFFTLSALTTNVMTELYNKKKAIGALILCTLINAVLAWHKFSLMLLIYFASLFLSLYCSVAIFEKFKLRLSFQVRNLVSIITAVSIDVSVLILPHLFIMQLPLQKVIDIFSRCLIYKMSYTLIIGFVILIISHIVLQISHKKKLSSGNM